MPVETRAQRGAAARSTFAAVPGLLGLAFQRLPAGEQAFTVGGLSREWCAWAAPRRAALADERGRCAAAAPAWLVKQVWDGLDWWPRRCQLWRAAWYGSLDVLKWAYQREPAFVIHHPNICSAAAHNGHLEVLQWARQQGCPWGTATCWLAAEAGHLAVLQWARQHGCPWDEETCAWAAEGGHLELLRWARQQGCPWDKSACAWAASCWPDVHEGIRSV
jgi:hypothetical protein